MGGKQDPEGGNSQWSKVQLQRIPGTLVFGDTANILETEIHQIKQKISA